MAHGVRPSILTRCEPVKSKTELTTNDLVRDHHEKRASHTENKTSNVTTRIVHHTSPEVREIAHETVRVEQGKPSNFRVHAENPLMPKRQVEFCEVSSVPVQRTILGAPRLPPKAPDCVVDSGNRNPLLKR
jgi:hypothetical protein